MNVLVTRSNLAQVIHQLNKKDLLVFDTETTGLKPYHGATIFSVAISDGTDNYYFNFKTYPGLEDIYVLERSWLQPLVSKERTWIAHNAKFDLHFMDKAGIRPIGPVYDTEVMARLFQNNHNYTGGYGLDACAKRWLGMEKDDRVKKWMDENNAFTVQPNHEGREEKIYFFSQVPFEIISEYAMKDGEVTFELYKFLQANMYENKAGAVEQALTPVLFEVEKVGVQIDRGYCSTAYNYELSRAAEAHKKLTALCGGEFTDSSKFLAPLLEQRGFVLPTTDAGNKQVSDEAISQKPDDPLVQGILEYREAMKRAHTYFANYMALADHENVIHTNFRQGGTVTGRMSSNNPNLQNIPAEDLGEYPIRRAFIPRPGFVFVSIDYAQMEFRLMLEYANQTDLIEKIKAGHDPHDATAELTGLSRKPAKTLNFGLLYGMGIAKLAKAIGVTEAEAKQFKWDYFGKLRGVKNFIKQAQYSQQSRGFTFNWAGRRYPLEIGKDGRDFSYKAANSIIQGGCADICKLAMVRLADFLASGAYTSRMVLQVHDEVLFEVATSELHIIPKLKEIMATAYEAKNMPLTCSVSYSTENFHDMIEVDANEAENAIREKLSEICSFEVKNPSKSMVLQSI